VENAGVKQFLSILGTARDFMPVDIPIRRLSVLLWLAENGSATLDEIVAGVGGGSSAVYGDLGALSRIDHDGGKGLRYVRTLKDGPSNCRLRYALTSPGETVAFMIATATPAAE